MGARARYCLKRNRTTGKGAALAEKNVHAAGSPDTMPTLNVPDSIAENMDLFLRLVRKVLDEFDPGLLETFDVLLSDAFRANAD